MDRVHYMDQSGLYALEDVLIELCQKKITSLVVGLNDQPRYLVSSIGILKSLIPEDYIFSHFKLVDHR